MLSHIDVHYLAAILTQIGTDWGVEIELGEMVEDVVAEKGRDVDITARYKQSDGTVTEFHGIEVKDEKRPLDVQVVEQIIAKLRDMPSLTKHALVSSSGFSEAAKKKARHYGLEMYHFHDWDGKGLQVDLSQMTFEFKAEEWESVTAFPVIDCPPPKGDEEKPGEVSLASIVSDPYNSGTMRPLREVMNLVCDDALNKAAAQVRENPDLAESERFNVDIPIDLLTTFEITAGEKTMNVSKVQVQGIVIIKNHAVQTALKALVRDGEDKPVAGCMIAELPDRSLWLFMASSREGSLTARIISVADRGKKKIYQEKMTTIPPKGPQRLGH
jgi:hypothetical protein